MNLLHLGVLLDVQGLALRDGMPVILVTESGAERRAVARYDPAWGGYFAELTT